MLQFQPLAFVGEKRSESMPPCSAPLPAQRARSSRRWRNNELALKFKGLKSCASQNAAAI